MICCFRRKPAGGELEARGGKSTKKQEASVDHAGKRQQADRERYPQRARAAGPSPKRQLCQMEHSVAGLVAVMV